MNIFALNTIPIAVTGAFPYATRIWFSTMVEILINAEKIAVGRPVAQTLVSTWFLHVKYFGRMEKV